MPYHRGAHIVSSAGFNLITDNLPDAVEGLMSEFIYFAFTEVHRALLWQRAFGHADDAVFLPHLETTFHRLANICNIKRNFRDHGVVRAACHSRVKCNPADVTSHYFDDQNAVMRLCRGV